MEFRLEFTPKAFNCQLDHQEQLLLIGSCFTENIGSKLRQLKFDVLENPNGILFNPASIVMALEGYINNRQYNEHELFYHNESWHSWEHHSRFSHPDPAECVRIINVSQNNAHNYLKSAAWLMITVGSAFVYELTPQVYSEGFSGRVVANCHKVPTDKFRKKLLAPNEISTVLDNLLMRLFEFNPAIKVIFTISPVRHLRDGFIENNRSKSALMQAIHPLIDKNDRLYYFPAYELVIDDLRDYRFYADDMVHPNYAATNYVWEKFQAACINERSRQRMKEIGQLNLARNHKPFNAGSIQHKRFLQVNLDNAKRLAGENPWLKLEEELAYFSSGIL